MAMINEATSCIGPSYANVAKSSFKKQNPDRESELNNKIPIQKINNANKNTIESRFHRTTLDDFLKLDMLTLTSEAHGNVTKENWSDETLNIITEKFNATLPNSLFASFKRFFTDRSIVIAVTDMNCSLYRFPKELLFEALSTNDTWDTIYRIADHPNPRYIVLEFHNAEQKDRFRRNFKVLDRYAIIVINPNRDRYITGVLKNAFLGYNIDDFRRLIEPFGIAVSLQPMLLRNTPVPVYGNRYEFKVKLHKGINPNEIPSLITDQEATLFLQIRGLKPQCFHCKQRGHVVDTCPNLLCSYCNQIATSAHQCSIANSGIKDPARKSTNVENFNSSNNASLNTIDHQRAHEELPVVNGIDITKHCHSGPSEIDATSNKKQSISLRNELDAIAVNKTAIEIMDEASKPDKLKTDKIVNNPTEKRKPGRPVRVKRGRKPASGKNSSDNEELSNSDELIKKVKTVHKEIQESKTDDVVVDVPIEANEVSIPSSFSDLDIGSGIQHEKLTENMFYSCRTREEALELANDIPLITFF